MDIDNVQREEVRDVEELALLVTELEKQRVSLQLSYPGCTLVRSNIIKCTIGIGSSTGLRLPVAHALLLSWALSTHVCHFVWRLRSFVV